MIDQLFVVSMFVWCSIPSSTNYLAKRMCCLLHHGEECGCAGNCVGFLTILFSLYKDGLFAAV